MKMQITFRAVIVIIAVLTTAGLKAQEQMTLQDAIAFGMENNFQLKIARNQVTMSENNELLGKGVFMPDVSLNSSVTKNLNSTRQERYDGTVTEKEDARTTTSNANAQLGWVLFDGMQMFAENSRYKNLTALSQTQLRMDIENSVAQIVTLYYGLVQQTKSMAVQQQAFNYSVMRRTLAYHRFRLGIASETDYLQASVDANADSAAWVNLQYAARNSNAALCRLIAKPYDAAIIPVDTIIQSADYKFDTLLEAALGNNTDLQSAELQQRLSQINKRVAMAPAYPKLSFNASYAYNLMEAEVGILRSNRTVGPSAGLTLSYALFNGFNTRVNSRNAKLQVESATWQHENTLEQVKSDLLKLYNDYQNQQLQAHVSQGNVELARRNTTIAWQRYKLGEIADLDFRQIQYVQTETENQLILSQFKVKQIETELLRLSGLLLVNSR